MSGGSASAAGRRPTTRPLVARGRAGPERVATRTGGRPAPAVRGRHDRARMRSVTTPFATPRVRRRRWVRRVIIAVLASVVLAVAAFGLLLALTPSVSDAEARTHQLAAAHGVVDTGAAVPSTFAAALVATEDSRFFSHHGIDTPGALRAVGGLVGLSTDSGGATLDQQLAKMLYFDGQRNTTDQVQEVALALKLDASYAKPEILQMYAQTAYFGNQAYGLDAASCRYFGEPAADLGWSQASLLAGLVQAPTAYDPVQHPALARARQSHVLDRLVSMGVLTPAEAAAAGSAPWRLVDPAQVPAVPCRG